MKEKGVNPTDPGEYIFAIGDKNEGFRAAILPQNEETKKLGNKIRDDDINRIKDVFEAIQELIDDENTEYVISGDVTEIKERIIDDREKPIFANGEITSSKRDPKASGEWHIREGMAPYIKVTEKVEEVDITREFTDSKGGNSSIGDDDFWFILHMECSKSEN